jgi:hypothetical protein
MQSPQVDKIRLAQRAALLFWIAAQVLNASTLPGQPEWLIGAWKPGTEVPPIGDQPARAFAPAAAVETIDSALFDSEAKPERPVELWPDPRPWAVQLPPSRGSDPLRAVEPPTWMLLGAATLLLATTNTRHHRRRTHTGCRHAAEPVAPTKKPRPIPWQGEGAAVESVCDSQSAH